MYGDSLDFNLPERLLPDVPDHVVEFRLFVTVQLDVFWDVHLIVVSPLWATLPLSAVISAVGAGHWLSGGGEAVQLPLPSIVPVFVWPQTLGDELQELPYPFIVYTKLKVMVPFAVRVCIWPFVIVGPV